MSLDLTDGARADRWRAITGDAIKALTTDNLEFVAETVAEDLGNGNVDGAIGLLLGLGLMGGILGALQTAYRVRARGVTRGFSGRQPASEKDLEAADRRLAIEAELVLDLLRREVAYPALARDLVARAAEGFEWPADRMLSLAELRRAYATGALNRGWTLTLDNDVTHVYAPVDPADRVKSWDELGDEDPDTVCIFRMHPADLMDAVLARLEIPAEGA